MTDPRTDERAPAPHAEAARDAGLRRLSRLTRRAVAVAAALTGVFAAVAANAFPGRSSTPSAHPGRQRAPAATSPGRSAPAGRADSGSAARPPAPPPLQPPAQAPAPAPAPPVAVSGGS